MRRLLAVFLCLVITLCCLPCPALAAETAFSDVQPDDWFAPYVAVCVEEGLMQGTGNGAFSPNNTLTDMECLTLFLRVYDLQRGGDGTLERLPEDWGDLTLTTADGRSVSGQFGDPFDFYSFKRDGNADAHLCFYVPDDELDWGKSVDARSAALTFSGAACTGIAQFWDPDKDNLNWVLSFYPDSWEDQSAIRDLYRDSQVPPERWWRSAVYTARVWGLRSSDTPELSRLAQSTDGVSTSRYRFALALSEVAGELDIINNITQLPDTDKEEILCLYQAGILTGTDELGSFHPYDTLTRAEAAAMLARVLRPELRKEATVDARHPEELTGLEVRHSSFGQTECKYTLDFEEKAFTTWYSGYFQGAEDREETTVLTDEALAGFWQSQAPEALLRWGEVYYNINIMDGHQWGVTLTFSDGETREINGSNAYPPGWDLVYDALLELTGHNVMDVRSNWLNH